MSMEQIRLLYKDPNNMKSVIIESYGNGNIHHTSELATIIKNARENSLFTFNTTQCHQGAVLDKEINSAVHFGAINCGDMVMPAVFAKVSQIMACKVNWISNRNLS